MLGPILKLFEIWNNVDGVVGTGEMVLTQGAIEYADRQIDAAASRYALNRNDKSIEAEVKRIEQYLENQMNSHTSPTDFVNTDFGTKKLAQARQSLLVREIYMKLRLYQAMDMLPTTSKRTWAERRQSLLRMRQGLVTMTLQFEAIVRSKSKDLKATREFQAKITGIAMGGDVTEADLKVLQHDMNEQEADAKKIQQTISYFALLANAGHKSVKNIDAILSAGDKRARSH